jgi:hypothetical protein
MRSIAVLGIALAARAVPAVAVAEEPRVVVITMRSITVS